MLRRIEDWDRVYDNAPAIPGGDTWPDRWVAPAGSFRDRMLAEGRLTADLRYGPLQRNVMDLFMPTGTAQGLLIFVHGGFWMALDKSFWSHLAEGPLAQGYAVAIPSYTLAPATRVADITHEIGAMVTVAADLVPGAIHLAGHSAGGHLVTRMVSDTTPLAPAVLGRIGNVLSISGLHDLRPVMNYWRNRVIGLDPTEAEAESPALLSPVAGTRLTCWVGGMETSEFLRQSALLANIWTGLGAATESIIEPDRHHFNVIDGLADPDHPMLQSLLA